MNQPKQMTVSVESIALGGRARKAYRDIESLAAEINERGLMHPVVLEEKPDGSGYLLVAGGRRLKAIADILKWTEVPASIYPPLDEYEHEAAELAENLHRDDLTFAEKAASVKRVQLLFEKKYGVQHGSGGGHSQKDTARILGVSDSTVQREIEIANALEILPALAECKNATEVVKKWRRIEESILRDELSKRADEILAHDGQAELKRRLISNYHVGDFFKGAEQLPSASFHCVEIDPPYAINMPGKKKGLDINVDNYKEVSPEVYPKFIDRVIAESKRLLFSDGWLILWFGIQPWYHTIEQLLTKHGFTLCLPALWVKPAGQTNWPDRYMASCYESFFYARKGNAILYRQGRSNVFSFSPVFADDKIHPTERPVELMQAVLECFAPPCGRVLVPFGGSGNTLLAAANLGMSSTCWDLAKEYKDAFTAKVLGEEYAKYTSSGH